MGNQESSAPAAPVGATGTSGVIGTATANKPRGHVTETLVPSRRMSVDRLVIIATLPNQIQPWQKSHDKILESAFSGIWSNLSWHQMMQRSRQNQQNSQQYQMPKGRIGQFTVFAEELNKLFVGYGISHYGEILNDIWSLDLQSLQWKKLQLKGDKVEGRIGSSATINGNTIFVFGGSVDKKYVSDLHTINIETGEVNMLKTHNDEYSPSARATPIVQSCKENLIVWGGFNGNFPTELHILNLETFTWSSKDPKITGRAGIPWAVVKDKIYIYGGAKGGEMLIIDPEAFSIEVKPCTGILPPSENNSFSMINVDDKYLFFFGGKANTDWTFLYACDISKLSWFVFDTVPDGNSVTNDDGHISDLGLFMLPRMHSLSAAYSKAKRALIGCFGYPQVDPPSFYAIDIGEALSILKLRVDMVEVLKETSVVEKGEKIVPGIVRASRAIGDGNEADLPEEQINDI